MIIKNYFDNAIKLISNSHFNDNRGFFSEIYNKSIFKKNDINLNFVQDNFSFTLNKGVFRGLHFQTPPFEQSKYVKVLSGEIYDIIVDLRKESPTYGKHKFFKLNAKMWNSLFVSAGFAHGFLTLSKNVMLYYKVSKHYSANHDCTIKWDDPDLNISLPMDKHKIITSDKDSVGINFKNFKSPFV